MKFRYFYDRLLLMADSLMGSNYIAKERRKRQICDKWQKENPATIAVAGFLKGSNQRLLN